MEAMKKMCNSKTSWQTLQQAVVCGSNMLHQAAALPLPWRRNQ
jgi:hypothetical protein